MADNNHTIIAELAIEYQRSLHEHNEILDHLSRQKAEMKRTSRRLEEAKSKLKNAESRLDAFIQQQASGSNRQAAKIEDSN